MIDITDVILHKNEKQNVYSYIYIFILEFKIGFSSEVSLMYIGFWGFQKGSTRKNNERHHSD